MKTAWQGPSGPLSGEQGPSGPLSGEQGPSSPSRGEVESQFRAEGLSPSTWGNGPGDTYGWHSHGYHKVLYCVSGSIVFHLRDGDVDLAPGDRLDVPPGTEHAATVGPQGVECMEARA